MPRIATQPPAVIILDIALPLGEINVRKLRADTSDVEGEGKEAIAYKAGLRCLKLLREDRRARQVPVILHTIYNRQNFPELPAESGTLILITKQEQYGRLIRAIGSFLALQGADVASDGGMAAISSRTRAVARDVFVVMPFHRAHIDTLETIRLSGVQGWQDAPNHPNR